MDTYKLFLTGTLVVLLFACSSSPDQVEATAPEAAIVCVFPDTDVPAPGWICDEPLSGIPVSAVGIADKSAAGVSFMKDVAAADARGKLAEQFKVEVSKMVKNYFGTTGAANAETVDRAAESVVKTVSSATLVGSKILRSRTAPDGRLFVLVGLDTDIIQQAAEKSIRTSMSDDRALWQKFQAKQALEELASDISQQRVP